MAGEWRARPLAEVAEIFDGPHATPAKTESGPVFLGISNLANGRVDLSNTEHLSVEDYVRWTRRVQPKAGDVVFSYETRLGEAARVPEGLRCCLGRRMGLLRARKDQVDERFLLYAYLGPQFQEILRSRTIPGSTVDRIPLVDMPSFPILLPSDQNEQRAIAHILGTLDDKIEVNRRMSATLEAMARALFKSWFVDFEPVRAKAEGGDPGLPPHLAALFPDRLVETEHGEVPEGWEVRTVEDAMALAYGKALKASERVDGPVPVYGSGGVTGYHNESLVDGPSIIVGRKGTVGSLHWEDRPFFPIDTVFYVLPKAPLTFCFYHLQTLGLDAMNTDAAVPGLNRNNVYRLHVTWSPDALRECFDEIVLGYRRRMRAADDEVETLAAIRDTLLPKLISGELRVKDAERALASA
jgi:type I restriction enzyme S subunit